MLKPRVLVVDDDAGVRYTLREILEASGLEVDVASDGVEALERLQLAPAQLVVTDLRMPRMDGMELLRKLVAQNPAPRVVVITAHGSERQAVDAIKAGALDYFRKPFEADELVAVIRRATETARLALENERLRGELALSRTLVFASEAMSALAVLVGRVAPRDSTVLITGESGTGKERLAEAIVRASRRTAKPFVRFNCASLTAELAEAELFGHTRGAFTGAVRSRGGLFGEADGGTILLDEIGEMDPAVQTKLLRLIQDGVLRPVGDDVDQRIDVRILAATNRKLDSDVASGRFRADLFWRLNVIPIEVPPLRNRATDIPLLCEHFVRRFNEKNRRNLTGLLPESLSALRQYNWPGNIRELENLLERLVILKGTGTIGLADLPPPLRGTSAGRVTPLADVADLPTDGTDLRAILEGVEDRMIAEALERIGVMKIVV